MPRKSSRPVKASRVKRAECESVQFAEVEFTAPVVPRLVIRFSEGLSVLVEDERSVPLAAPSSPRSAPTRREVPNDRSR